MPRTLACVVCFLALGVTTSGCSPRRTALSHDMAAEILSVRLESAVPQSGLQIRVEQSRAGASFGLIGVLIDAGVTSSRQSEADEALLSLRAALYDFDFREEFWSALQSALDSTEWPQPIVFIRSTDEPLRDVEPKFLAKMSALEEDAYVSLKTEYFLSPDAARLTVKSSIALYRGGAKTRYSSRFTYCSMPTGSSSVSRSLNAWAEDDAIACRRALRQGIDSTIRMLHRDFLDGHAGKIDQEALRSLAEQEFVLGDLEGVGSSTVKGRVISRDDGVVLVRASSGFLYAFPEDMSRSSEPTR